MSEAAVDYARTPAGETIQALELLQVRHVTTSQYLEADTNASAAFRSSARRAA